jgi:hypothetical protein
MAVATKDQAAGLFLLLPLVLIPILIKEYKEKNARVWYPMLSFGGAGVLVYALGSGLLFDSTRYFEHLNFIFNTNQVNIVAKYNLSYEPTLAGMAALTGKFFQAPILIMGPVIVLFACVAVAQSAWTDRRRFAFALPIVSYLVTMILPMRYMQGRYAMPVTLIAAVFAARGLSSGFKFATRSKPVMALVLLVALAWPLFLSLDLDVRMRTDSRYQAEDWLSRNVSTNGSIGYISSVNALPRLRADVQLTSIPIETAAFEYLQTKGPEYLIVVPDWTSDPGMNHSKFCPSSLYDRLNDGSLGYTLAKTFEPQEFIQRQLLDYPSVSPPVRIFTRTDVQSVGRQ